MLLGSERPVLRIRQDVGHVRGAELHGGSSRDGCSIGPKLRSLATGREPLQKSSGRAMMGDDAQDATVEPIEERPLRRAQPRRVLGEDLEDRLEIERRAADDLQHLAGGRLPLQGFGQIAVPRLHLGEQADVLYGDDGLIGKRLQQCNLPVWERTGSGAGNGDRPNCVAVAEHRDAHRASECGGLGRRTEIVARLGMDVRDVRDLAVEDCASRCGAPVRRARESLSNGLVAFRGQSVVGDEM